MVTVRAGPDRAYRAVREVDLSDSAVIRSLFALRGLPRRGPLSLDDLPRIGFVILAEDPGREIVLGLVGRFWRARGGLRRVAPGEFDAFAEPGFAKAAWNFLVEPAGGGRSAVSTETRVVTTDPASLRSFRRYWRLAGPFSALVRRRTLALIREGAERPGP